MHTSRSSVKFCCQHRQRHRAAHWTWLNAHHAVFGCIERLTADEYNIFAADGVLYLFPHCMGRKSDGTYDQNVPKFAFCCWLLFFSIQNRLPICVLSSALLRLLWRLLCCTVLHMRSDGVISQTRSSPPDGFTTNLNSDKFIIREIFVNKSNSIATDV